MSTDNRLIFPEEPYRGIESFRFLDRNVFFGREEEVDDLLQTITIFRGTLLFGASGIGKSSLISAGLLPEAIKRNFIPDKIRVQPIRGAEFVIENLNAGAKESADDFILQSSFFFKGENTERKTISAEYLGEVVRSAKKNWVEYVSRGNPTLNEQRASRPPTLLLIFDQFEEIITQFDDRKNGPDFDERMEVQSEVFSLLKDLIYDNDLPVNFLFSFREDYLPNLSKFLNEIPDLKNNSIRLEPIDTVAANISSVIKNPIQQDYAPDYYKRKLSGILLEEIAEYFLSKTKTTHGSLLSEIQIVCQTLWRSEHPSDLLATKGCDGILNYYFKEKIKLIPKEYESVAQEILVHLVLNNARNIVSKYSLFKELSEVFPEKEQGFLHKAIDELKREDVKLIREDHRSSDIICYEIVSEYLIPSIADIVEEQKRNKEKIRLQEEAKKRELQVRKKLQLLVFIIFVLFSFLIIFSYLYIRAENAKNEAEVATILSKTMLAKADSLIGAFYFYDDKYALAYNDTRFYFIDKNGKEIGKLGRWEKAGQFDYTGFATVFDYPNEYLIDTFGNKYKVINDVKEDNLESFANVLRLPSKRLTNLDNILFDSTEEKARWLSRYIRLYSETSKFDNLFLFKNIDLYPSSEMLTKTESENELLWLDVASNSISNIKFRKHYYSLKNLQILNASFNKLTNVTGLENLRYLKVINLSFNKIEYLPQQIDNLVNLTELDISNNKLRELPKSLCSLKELRVLDISQNRLSTLPDDFGKLEKIKRLDIGKNNFRTLPPTFSHLVNLEDLYIQDCRFLNWKQAITVFEKMQREVKLWVYDEERRSFSFYPKRPADSSVKNNETIKTTNVDGKVVVKINNRDLLRIGDDIPKKYYNTITSLGFSDLPSNDIEKILPLIYKMDSLEELHISLNGITTFPTGLFRIKNMHTLDISYNSLSEVPRQIALLTKLNVLDLSSNDLRTLPIEIARLKELYYLDLGQNDNLDWVSMKALVATFAKKVLFTNQYSDERELVTGTLLIKLNDEEILKALKYFPRNIAPGALDAMSISISRNISDDVLDGLRKFKNLQSVDIDRDNVSDDLIEKIKQLFPRYETTISSKSTLRLEIKK